MRKEGLRGILLLLLVGVSLVLEASIVDGGHVQIDGASNPDLIPFVTKMDAFFSTYFDLQVKPNLSSADQLKVAKMAGKHQSNIKERNFESRAILADEMCKFVQQGFEVEEIARVIQEVEKLHDEKAEKFYLKFMEKLSIPGQIELLNYIDENVAPRIGYAKLDHVQLAQQYPELMKKRYEERCQTFLENVAKGT